MSPEHVCFSFQEVVNKKALFITVYHIIIAAQRSVRYRKNLNDDSHSTHSNLILSMTG